MMGTVHWHRMLPNSQAALADEAAEAARRERDEALVRIKAMENALTPVQGLYCGELEYLDPVELLKAVVVDFQADRAANIELRHKLRLVEAELQRVKGKRDED